MAADSHKELQKSVTFGNWVRKDIQYSQFQNYELTYAHFVRFPTPFSWGIWQPGSSPGNTWILTYSLYLLWRDANNLFFLSNFLTLNIFSTNTNSSDTSNTTNIPSQTLAVVDNSMHVILSAYQIFSKNSLNQDRKYEIIFKVHFNGPNLAFHNWKNIKKLENKIWHQRSINSVITTKKLNEIGLQKHRTQKINYSRFFNEQLHRYMNLCRPKVNFLLKCQIVIYQIRVRLITSWWRDKISW